MAKRLSYRKHDRVPQFGPFTTELSLCDIGAALLPGVTLCIPDENERLSNLSEAIEKMKTNPADLTPRASRVLQASEVPSRQILTLGGERITSQDLRQWSGHVKELHIAHGGTKCATTSTVRMHDGDFNGSNIGTAMASHT